MYLKDQNYTNVLHQSTYNCDVDYRLRIIESIYLKFDKQSFNTQEYSIRRCLTSAPRRLYR